MVSFWKPSRTWMLAATLTACSPSSQPAAAPPPLPTVTTAAPATPATSGPLTVAVRFTHAAIDRWTAEYDLSAPVRVLAFRRPRTSRAGWHVVEPEGAKLSAGFVVAKAPFRRFVVDLPTATEEPEKDYRPFYRYSDRGLLAYTGQLGIEQASCAGGGCEDGPSPVRGAVIPGLLTLKAGPGEHVVVRGQPAGLDASLALGGDDDDGTYAYFGDLSPVDSPELVGVVDRAFPAWLRERMVADLPRVFALYADRLGPLAGDARATLFLTFTALDRELGYSIGGGVLRPRVVNLDVELGRAFLSEGDPRTLADLDHIVAHEGVHLWNGDQYLHSGSRARTGSTRGPPTRWPCAPSTPSARSTTPRTSRSSLRQPRSALSGSRTASPLRRPRAAATRALSTPAAPQSGSWLRRR